MSMPKMRKKFRNMQLATLMWQKLCWQRRKNYKFFP